MNGTWKTTGGSGSVLPLAAVTAAVLLIGSGAVSAAAAVLTELAVIVAACAMAAVVVVLAAVVVLWRKYGHHPAPLPEQAAAFRSAARAQRLRAAPQSTQITAPAQHFHVHYHGTAQPEGVPSALRAIKDGEQI